MKLPLSLSKRDNPEVLSASRAEEISRIWQAIAFIEEIRASLRTTRSEDPVGVALTASTHQLQIAAGLMQPRQPQARELPAGVKEERRNAAG